MKLINRRSAWWLCLGFTIGNVFISQNPDPYLAALLVITALETK